MKNGPMTMSELWLLAGCIQHSVLSLYSSYDLFVQMIPCTYFPLSTDDYSDILNVYFPMEAGCDLISVFVCLSVCLSDSRNYWSDFHENRQERTDYIFGSHPHPDSHGRSLNLVHGGLAGAHGERV